MIKKDTAVSFEYHALNSNNDPVDLTFSFRKNSSYKENLMLFLVILQEAQKEVTKELDLESNP